MTGGRKLDQILQKSSQNTDLRSGSGRDPAIKWNIPDFSKGLAVVAEISESLRVSALIYAHRR